MPQYGDILNKHEVTDVISGPVKASTSLAIGLVKEDGSNGWQQAASGDDAKLLYFNPIAIDNSSGAKGDKIGTFWGQGAKVVGKAEGAIVVDANVQAGATNPEDFLTNTISAVGDIADSVGKYLGHVHEQTESGSSRTNAADNDEDCVFLIERAV